MAMQVSNHPQKTCHSRLTRPESGKQAWVNAVPETLSLLMNSRNKNPESVRPGIPTAPPPINLFPAYPASWYLFCRSDDLEKPYAKRILGRQLVGFRTQRGKVVVIAAHCSHMGADLGCGTVVGESIQCPFHNWKYGADGICNHIPGTNAIP